VIENTDIRQTLNGTKIYNSAYKRLLLNRFLYLTNQYTEIRFSIFIPTKEIARTNPDKQRWHGRTAFVYLGFTAKLSLL